MADQDTTGRLAGGSTSQGSGPTGCRVHKPEYDFARDAAEAWTGREGGLDHWTLHKLLEKEGVAERFGLNARHLNYLDASFKKLRPEDFEPGGWPPTVWITKEKLRKKTRAGSLRAVSEIEKDLARAGFLYWTDTASRRRDGKRSKRDGRIKWAYGVDFSPFAAKAQEIEDTVRLVEVEQIESKRLIHQISTMRCHTRILLQAAIRRNPASIADLNSLLNQVLALPTAKEMNTDDVHVLRSLEEKARLFKERAIALTEPSRPAQENLPVDEAEGPDHAGSSADRVRDCTLGYNSRAGSNSITHQLDEISNLVAADPPAEPSPEPPDPPAAPPSPERGTGSPSGRSPVSEGPPEWLILDSLSPRLSRFLPLGRPPTADEFLQAANRTRSELGISPEAWREACTGLSPAWACMATVIIASRDDVGEIHTSAGGYFRRLTERARKRTLNLAGSLWGVIERSEQLHVARIAPATEGDDPCISGPDPSLRSVPVRFGGRRADQPTMAAACRTAADPQALLLAWRELVTRYRCWPYLDEVEQLHADRAGLRDVTDGGSVSGGNADHESSDPRKAGLQRQMKEEIA